MRLLRVALVFCALLSAHCNATIDGDGVAGDATRDVASFTSVRNEIEADVEIQIGEPGSLSIACDQNLLRHILTEVDGDELVVRTGSGVSLAPRLACIVRAPTAHLAQTALDGSGDLVVRGAAADEVRVVGLRGSGNTTIEAPVSSSTLRIDLLGSGAVNVRSFEGDALTVNLPGSGDVTVGAGRATSLDVSIDGSGDVGASGLVALDATASIAGSGSVALRCTRSVDVHIAGSGAATIYGAPRHRSKNITGSGAVEFR